MKNNATFEKDLSDETKFGQYLDSLYPKIKSLENKFSFHRKSDMKNQYKGIDLILKDKNSKRERYIDEKAQLHYLNKSLNTFTFELSYLKDGNLKKGWFYDENKCTHTYFLFTSIQTDTNNNFTSCRFISINRKYLQNFLEKKGLTEEKILMYEKIFRADSKRYDGEQPITEIDKRFATFHCSFSKLGEKPINLKINLKALIDNKLAYEFIPCGIKGKSK